VFLGDVFIKMQQREIRIDVALEPAQQLDRAGAFIRLRRGRPPRWSIIASSPGCSTRQRIRRIWRGLTR
jgi:hypothetical protein